MTSAATQSILFAGREFAAAATVGFRPSAKGTHTSRTMMLAELRATLDTVPATAHRGAYISAIVDDNCTHKPTASTRRRTAKALSELYGLDPRIPLFRVLRRLWDASPEGRGLLALLCVLARDPRFLATAPYIIAMREGAEFHRGEMRDAIAAADGAGLGDATLDKVVRNSASSWLQSGHLVGRTFKKRCLVRPTAAVAAFAAYLALNAGVTPAEMFHSGWFQVLDVPPARARALLLEAKQLGLIDLRMAGDVTIVGFDRLDPALRRT